MQHEQPPEITGSAPAPSSVDDYIVISSSGVQPDMSNPSSARDLKLQPQLESNANLNDSNSIRPPTHVVSLEALSESERLRKQQRQTDRQKAKIKGQDAVRTSAKKDESYSRKRHSLFTPHRTAPKDALPLDTLTSLRDHRELYPEFARPDKRKSTDEVSMHGQDDNIVPKRVRPAKLNRNTQAELRGPRIFGAVILVLLVLHGFGVFGYTYQLLFPEAAVETPLAASSSEEAMLPPTVTVTVIKEVMQTLAAQMQNSRSHPHMVHQEWRQEVTRAIFGFTLPLVLLGFLLGCIFKPLWTLVFTHPATDH